MTAAALRDLLLKGLLLLVPLLFLPWMEDPYRLFRESLFQLAACGLLLLWLYGRLTGEKGVSLDPGPFRTDLSLFGAGLAAIVLSLVLHGGGVSIAANIVLGGVLFLAFVNALRPDSAPRWVALFGIAAGLNALLAISQFAGFDPFFSSTDPDFHALYRRYVTAGFMDSPNMLAPFLASFVPMAGAYFLYAAGTRNRLLWGAAVALLALPLGLTQNIGGIAPLALVSALMLAAVTLLAAARADRKKSILLAACWLILAAAAFTAWHLYQRTDETSRILKQYSMDERRTQNEACLLMFNAAPLTGKGPGFFYAHFTEYRRAVWFQHPPLRLPDREAHQAHNDYLQLLAEGGLLAALPFTALLLYWLYRHGTAIAGLRRHAATAYEPLLLGAAGGFWVIALNGLGNFPFHIAPLAVAAIFWAALASVTAQGGEHA